MVTLGLSRLADLSIPFPERPCLWATSGLSLVGVGTITFLACVRLCMVADRYQVTVWYKDDETYEVEASDEDEAREKAKEKLEGDTGTWGAEPTNTRVELLNDDGMTEDVGGE